MACVILRIINPEYFYFGPFIKKYMQISKEQTKKYRIISIEEYG